MLLFKVVAIHSLYLSRRIKKNLLFMSSSHATGLAEFCSIIKMVKENSLFSLIKALILEKLNMI